MTESQYITTSHKYQMRMSRSPVKSNCAVMLEYVTRVPMETTLSVYWGQCPLTNHGMQRKYYFCSLQITPVHASTSGTVRSIRRSGVPSAVYATTCTYRLNYFMKIACIYMYGPTDESHCRYSLTHHACGRAHLLGVCARPQQALVRVCEWRK